jgi:hypothetical protein
MKIIILGCLMGFTSLQAGDAISILLPAKPSSLLDDEAKFRLFAESLGHEVEKQLGQPEAVDDAEQLKMLLSIRVHLAHCLADYAKATVTAAWIRSLQTDPAQRAYAGLTTFAVVEARQRYPAMPLQDQVVRAAFRESFGRRLMDLTDTPEVLVVLHRQREIIAGFDADLLLQELNEMVDPKNTMGGRSSLQLADMAVRVIHRRVAMLPLKVELLAALDSAIAARE